MGDSQSKLLEEAFISEVGVHLVEPIILHGQGHMFRLDCCVTSPSVPEIVSVSKFIHHEEEE